MESMKIRISLNSRSVVGPNILIAGRRLMKIFDDLRKLREASTAFIKTLQNYGLGDEDIINELKTQIDQLKKED